MDGVRLKPDATYVTVIVSGELSSVGRAVKDWLLGTQAAPACEAGALIQGRLMTADRSQRAGEARRAFSDIRKARRDLGYNPCTPLRDGLVCTRDWFLEGLSS